MNILTSLLVMTCGLGQNPIVMKKTNKVNPRLTHYSPFLQSHSLAVPLAIMPYWDRTAKTGDGLERVGASALTYYGLRLHEQTVKLSLFPTESELKLAGFFLESEKSILSMKHVANEYIMLKQVDILKARLEISDPQSYLPQYTIESLRPPMHAPNFKTQRELMDYTIPLGLAPNK